MKAILLGLLLLVPVLDLRADGLPVNKDFSATGKFYISIDDVADIRLNGKEFFVASLAKNKMPSCTSPEVALHPGDRLVVRLKNVVGQHQFLITFVSTEKQIEVPFTYRNFKSLPDTTATDFTEAEFGQMSKTAKKEIKKHPKPPYGANSDWVWGDAEECTLGALVTPEMFKPLPKK